MPLSPRLLVPRATRLFLPTDADARAYVQAVINADKQPLEKPVVEAIEAFIVGCKTDGIWSAIKASCILMGAKTLSGALTPLVGSAPTNNNFVSGDYNRKTGLAGDGSTKSLNSNRNNNVDGQDDFHAALWVHTSGTTGGRGYFGAGPLSNESGASNIGIATGAGVHFFRCRNSSPLVDSSLVAGFLGIARAASNEYVSRSNSTNTTRTQSSQTPNNNNLFVFSLTNTAFATNARFSFYSIGSSLTLATLETRISALVTAIGAAIP
jgi:hypothetical protein